MSDDQERIWLIWSNEHRAWWAPDEHGYVGIIAAAGRYRFKTAKEICDGANRYLPAGKTHEVMVLSPEAAVALLADTEKIPVHEYPSGEVSAHEGHADIDGDDMVIDVTEDGKATITIFREDGSKVVRTIDCVRIDGEIDGAS